MARQGALSSLGLAGRHEASQTDNRHPSRPALYSIHFFVDCR